MPDMPEAAKDTALDWVKEIIKNSPVKKHVKMISVDNEVYINTEVEKFLQKYKLEVTK
jgi:hypothetical protein